MKGTMQSIILDFREAQLETGVPRRLHVEPVRGKAMACIGVRRSGKSTLLFQFIQGLVDNTASLYSIDRLTGYLQSLGRHAQGGRFHRLIAWPAAASGAGVRVARRAEDTQQRDSRIERSDGRA